MPATLPWLAACAAAFALAAPACAGAATGAVPAGGALLTIAAGDVESAPGVEVVGLRTDGVVVLSRGADVEAVPSGLTSVEALGVGDVTGDGRPDVVVGGSDGVAVLAGGEHLAPPVTSAAPRGYIGSRLAIVDLDADGRADVLTGFDAALAADGGRLHRFASVGGGLVLGNGPDSFAAGDVTGDGVPDAVVAGDLRSTGSDDGRIEVLVGRPGGSFAAGAPARIPRRTSVTIADTDGDGKPDLLVDHAGRVAIRPVSPTGRVLTPRATWGVVEDEEQLAVADVDRDGITDLVGLRGVDPESASNELGIARGLGGSRFDVPATRPAPGRRDGSVDEALRDLAVADVDGDGTPEVVAAGPDELRFLEAPAAPSGPEPFLLDGGAEIVGAFAGPDLGYRTSSDPTALHVRTAAGTDRRIALPAGAREVAIGPDGAVAVTCCGARPARLLTRRGDSWHELRAARRAGCFVASPARGARQIAFIRRGGSRCRARGAWTVGAAGQPQPLRMPRAGDGSGRLLPYALAGGETSIAALAAQDPPRPGYAGVRGEQAVVVWHAGRSRVLASAFDDHEVRFLLDDLAVDGDLVYWLATAYDDGEGTTTLERRTVEGGPLQGRAAPSCRIAVAGGTVLAQTVFGATATPFSTLPRKGPRTCL